LRDGSGGGVRVRGSGGGSIVADAVVASAGSRSGTPFGGVVSVNACPHRWQRTDRPGIAADQASDPWQPGHGNRSGIDAISQERDRPNEQTN
jgi:hypothetical protein